MDALWPVPRWVNLPTSRAKQVSQERMSAVDNRHRGHLTLEGELTPPAEGIVWLPLLIEVIGVNSQYSPTMMIEIEPRRSLRFSCGQITSAGWRRPAAQGWNGGIGRSFQTHH